jgi:hypothetical protein
VDNLSQNGLNLTCNSYDECDESLPSSWSGTTSLASNLSCQVYSGTNSFLLEGISESIITDDYEVSSGCDKIEINFKIKAESSTCSNGCYKLANGTTYSYSIRYSTNNGSTWSLLHQDYQSNSNPYSNWQTITKSVDDLSTISSIKFKIEAQSVYLSQTPSDNQGIDGCTGFVGGTNDWFIDDIIITSYLNGQATNGTNNINESSLWYLSNNEILSKVGNQVKIDGDNYEISFDDGLIDVGTIGTIDGQSSSEFTIKSLGDVIINADDNNNGNSSIRFKESGTELLTIQNDGKIGIGTSTPSTKLDVVGNTSISGTLNMNSNIISNVTDPISEQDASTKNYVDDQITNSETNTSLSAGNDISSSSLNNYTIALEDDIDVSTISASASGGVQIKDDGGNLGIHVDDGGNVGIGTNATSSKLAVDGDLDVDGDSRIGWHGAKDFITVTPFEVSPSTHTGDWEISNNGGYKRIYGGTDGYLTATAPVGYKITGYIFHFSNAPDEIEVFYCNVGATGANSLGTQSSYTTSNSIDIFQDSFNFNHDSADYISIRIINDGTNAFEFLGGIINIEKCTSGCGF